MLLRPRAAAAAAAAPVRRMSTPSPGQPWRCSGPTPRTCPYLRPTCRPRRRRAGAGRIPRIGAPPRWSLKTDDGDGDVGDGGRRRRRTRRWAPRRRVSSRARAARRVRAPAFAEGWGRGAMGQRERARGSPDDGDWEGRRRRAFGRRTPETRVSRQCRWDIPISGVDTLLSKGPPTARAATTVGSRRTPTARTGNGSGRRAYAPARRISRASGAGT